MGQEFLEWGAWQDSVQIDWTKSKTFAGITQLYRDLIHLRRNWFNNTRGLQGHNINVHHINDLDKVVAYHRWDQGGPGDDVVILANFANKEYGSYRIGVPRPGLWKVRFNSDWQGYSSVFHGVASYDTWTDGEGQDGMPASLVIGLGAYSTVILSQDK
jgi:1,4-alpha-glucan branching enzyme